MDEFMVYVPKMTMRPEIMKKYMDKYLQQHTFNYIREAVITRTNLRNQDNSIILNEIIENPRHIL